MCCSRPDRPIVFVRRPSENVTSSSCCPLPRCCLTRDVYVVVVSQLARGLSCRIPEPVIHSQSVHTLQPLFPFSSDLSRSQERQRVLEQHHRVSEGLRGVSRRGKLVYLWYFLLYCMLLHWRYNENNQQKRRAVDRGDATLDRCE